VQNDSIMKTKFTVLAMLLFLFGVTNAEAQRYRNSERYAYERTSQRDYDYDDAYDDDYDGCYDRKVVYVKPRHHHHKHRSHYYQKPVVYVKPGKHHHYKPVRRPRPVMHASVYIR